MLNFYLAFGPNFRIANIPRFPNTNAILTLPQPYRNPFFKPYPNLRREGFSWVLAILNFNQPLLQIVDPTIWCRKAFNIFIVTFIPSISYKIPILLKRPNLPIFIILIPLIFYVCLKTDLLNLRVFI